MTVNLALVSTMKIKFETEDFHSPQIVMDLKNVRFNMDLKNVRFNMNLMFIHTT